MNTGSGDHGGGPYTVKAGSGDGTVGSQCGPGSGWQWHGSGGGAPVKVGSEVGKDMGKHVEGGGKRKWGGGGEGGWEGG